MGSSDDWRDALAAAFPVTHGDLTLACIGIEEALAGPRACMRLSMEDDGEILWEVEQELELHGVSCSEIAAWSERARERLAMLETNDACTTPAALVVPPFLPLARPAEDEGLVPTITRGLRAQALDGGFEHRFDRLAAWPAIARTIYFLDLASALLGGSGLEVYLAQQCFEDVLGVLEALEAAGCERLALRTRQGLGVCAAEGGAEFLLEVGDDWLADNARPPPRGGGRAWARIDSREPDGTYELVMHELRPALERYVRAHLDVLVR